MLITVYIFCTFLHSLRGLTILKRGFEKRCRHQNARQKERQKNAAAEKNKQKTRRIGKIQTKQNETVTLHASPCPPEDTAEAVLSFADSFSDRRKKG